MYKSTAYLFKEYVYIHSSNETTAGVWLMSEPVYKVEKNDIELIGVKIKEALSSSKTGIPHPTNFKGLTDPLLNQANVKSYNTFAKNALCISINSDGQFIRLIPRVNNGPKGGYTAIEEQAEKLENPDPKELGEMILKVFGYCK
ncbi:hypothetical protein DU508_00065 [Pedobacter chinensis]|uniref:Uncharacterized protein n=1 Tax=Pedobacter chinensis TaxID=2282421 RepID=A0A369Q830_9SPHI|nr:hypothetical protein [Pedobacter chinensis]RDC58438.1 hypothetical protein DU508_00065 [Pedobacter chinensis]